MESSGRGPCVSPIILCFPLLRGNFVGGACLVCMCCYYIHMYPFVIFKPFTILLTCKYVIFAHFTQHKTISHKQAASHIMNFIKLNFHHKFTYLPVAWALQWHFQHRLVSYLWIQLKHITKGRHCDNKTHNQPS